MNIVRAAVERMYTGIMTVTEYKPVTDTVAKITSNQEIDIMTDVPCRISYNSVNAVNMQDGAAHTEQGIKTAEQLNISKAVKRRYILHIKKLCLNYLRGGRNGKMGQYRL